MKTPNAQSALAASLSRLKENMREAAGLPKINAQTPGPLRIGRRALAHEGPPIVDGAKDRVAYVLPHLLAVDANARLLATAYTAFDKAGRELGIDAATLAASVDVAALLEEVAGERGMSIKQMLGLLG